MNALNFVCFCRCISLLGSNRMAFYGENSSGRFCPRRVHCSEFAVSEFIDKHLIENQPVIIMGCTQDWQTRKQWIKEDGTPNFEFLLDQFGDLRVPITCCKSGKPQTIVFSEFIQQYFDNPQNDLYIRDWHFMNDSNVQWYEVPKYFQSDWVNNDALEHLNIFGGDYRFCYMGGSGTSTSFHSDVFNSYSWSANICGKKIWYMLPEGGELNLSAGPDNIIDLRSDPLFFEAGGFVFEQVLGEIVFVPTGWYHQVHNSGFAISINHNWINSFNFDKVVRLLLERLQCCIKEVRLMRDDLDKHAQKVEEFLRLDYGLNLKSAIDLCNLIIRNRTLFMEVDSSTMKNQCACLTDCNVCESCKKFMNSNDLLTCKRVLELLETKQDQLNSLEWLDEK